MPKSKTTKETRTKGPADRRIAATDLKKTAKPKAKTSGQPTMKRATIEKAPIDKTPAAAEKVILKKMRAPEVIVKKSAAPIVEPPAALPKVTPEIVTTTMEPMTPEQAAAHNYKNGESRGLDPTTDDLWREFKTTGAEPLRNLLIEKYYPMVRHIAERVLQTLPKSIDLDELSSAGVTGLMDAINGFDLTRGIKFKTYCTTRIRGSILDHLRAQDFVPRLVRLKAHRVERAIHELEARLGRRPTDFELAQHLSIPLARLETEMQDSSPKSMLSLSDRWDDDDDDRGGEKAELIEDKRTEDPLFSTHRRDLMDVITRNLTKKERQIFVMYYQEGLTMREIGEILKLTESRVCQIHSNVVARLKGQLDRIRPALLS
ncbi:MAG: FliA/WhiG family RNA polymerase sigma factor [Planctomycetota bacterium]